MSKFYGTVSGSARTEATRRGHDGIKVSAQSWDGSLITRMSHDGSGRLMVQLDKSNDSTSCWGKTIFWGTLDELEQKLTSEAAVNVVDDAFVDAFDQLSCIIARRQNSELDDAGLFSALCGLHDRMAKKIR